MTTPPLDSIPAFRPSWALPIMAGAGGTILWQLLITVFGASLGSGATVVMSCCGCCGFPIVLGSLPALLALSRDPDLRPGEGFTVSFIGVGAGVMVMLVAMYMEVSIAELRENLVAMARESIDSVTADQPDLDLSEAERQEMIEFARTVAPYMPLGVALLATLMSAVCGMISVILMRGRRRPPQSMISA